MKLMWFLSGIVQSSAIAGVGLIVWSARDFFKGNYLDGGLREREEQKKIVCVLYLYIRSWAVWSAGGFLLVKCHV